MAYSQELARKIIMLVLLAPCLQITVSGELFYILTQRILPFQNIILASKRLIIIVPWTKPCSNSGILLLSVCPQNVP